MCRLQNILLIMLVMLMASVSSLSAKEQYVDPVFGDTIDRTAEDFIKVSLLVADPGIASWSVFGHACLRMQCPTFGVDYCFSYESQSVKKRIGKFLSGHLLMGLFAIPVDEYCSYYREEGRGVYEYPLNLPPHIEQELWRVLDNHVAEGIYIPYDYFKRGCTITCIDFLDEALGDKKIQYGELPNNMTTRDYAYEYMKNFPWVWFAWNFICGIDGDEILHRERQLFFPFDLAKAWQNATIDGVQLAASNANVLLQGEAQMPQGWFTPMMMALIILILAIANMFWQKPYGDWVFLAMQTLIGAFMIYLICFSDLCCTSWNWLVIPFNILPVIAWRWRKYWSLAYSCILLLWCGIMAYMAMWGHVLVDWSHIVIVLAWLLVVLKQSRVFYALFTHYSRTISAQFSILA